MYHVYPTTFKEDGCQFLLYVGRVARKRCVGKDEGAAYKHIGGLPKPGHFYAANPIKRYKAGSVS